MVTIILEEFKNNRKKISGESTIHGGLDHSVSISASPKFGHFSLSPSLRLNSRWYNKRQIQGYNTALDTLGQDSSYYNSYDINEFNTLNTL